MTNGGEKMKQTDEEIIQLFKLRDERAFELLVKTYGGLINSIVSKHMYNLLSYQDECVNDILLAIWDYIECYDGTKNSFKNWIAILAKYKSLNYVKKYKKLNEEVELDKAYLVTEDEHLNRLLQHDTRKGLEAILGELKEKDRQLFTEIYFNDKSVEEVCKQTGKSKNYIYNRLSRGRKKLKTLWEREVPSDETQRI